MFAAVSPISKFQVAPAFTGTIYPAKGQENTASAIGLWEFPNEAELADDLLAALSNPLPVVSAPEIAPEDVERFCQGFLS